MTWVLHQSQALLKQKVTTFLRCAFPSLCVEYSLNVSQNSQFNFLYYPALDKYKKFCCWRQRVNELHGSTNPIISPSATCFNRTCLLVPPSNYAKQELKPRIPGLTSLVWEVIIFSSETQIDLSEEFYQVLQLLWDWSCQGLGMAELEPGRSYSC